jgi:hypothetical protein
MCAPEDFSSRKKRQSREVQRSPVSSAEMKNKWSYNSTPSSWYPQGQIYLFIALREHGDYSVITITHLRVFYQVLEKEVYTGSKR